VLDRRGHLSLEAIVIPVLFAILLVGCSSSDDTQTETTTPQHNATTSTAVTTPPPDVTTTDAQSPTTTVAPTTSTQPPTTTTTLPGESYWGPGPQAGDLVAVVGVAHADALMVREGPGTRYPVTGTLKPTQTGIPVTGEAWLLPKSIWNEVATDQGTGWVNSAYIGLFGSTDEATLEVYELLGEPLADDDLASLGATIAFAFLTDEGGGWIALVEPSEGGSTSDASSIIHSSITYDVVGLSDDSIKGYRLVIFATQNTANSPFVLHSVERTYLCWRGIDPTGLCV